VVGTGVDLNAVREFINNTVMKFFDVSIFTSVFFAIAVQKPLEYVVKRAFRTE
jgi:cytosine/uracil/thiamine/allantoin permease